MSKLSNCPHCKANLIGGEIPEDIRHHYSPPYVWKREIGMEYPGVYDGVWEWKCPDCKGTWDSEAKLWKKERGLK